MTHSAQFVTDTIKKQWAPGKRILEIGCGAGLLRSEFGEDYWGVDITNAPYREDLPRTPNVVCDSSQLPIKDQSFEVVVIKSAFYIFPHYQRALAEAHRVLKNNGVIYIFDYNKRTQKRLQRIEGHNRYPCWTQWGLKNLLKRFKFKNIQLLLPQAAQPSGFEKWVYLVHQEIYGTWAIVQAIKFYHETVEEM